MANELKMAKKYAVLGLLEKGWSYRRIARELGIHRETIARYDRIENPKPSISPAGSEEGCGSKPANPPTGSVDGAGAKPANPPTGSMVIARRDSLCTPFQAEIENKLDLGLSAQRIYQDLRVETGFIGSYDSVKRFVRRLSGRTELPFRRMEMEPGQEAQVDFEIGRAHV